MVWFGPRSSHSTILYEKSAIGGDSGHPRTLRVCRDTIRRSVHDRSRQIPPPQVPQGFTVESQDRFARETGQWREILVEDRHANPAETALGDQHRQRTEQLVISQIRYAMRMPEQLLLPVPDGQLRARTVLKEIGAEHHFQSVDHANLQASVGNSRIDPMGQVENFHQMLHQQQQRRSKIAQALDFQFFEILAQLDSGEAREAARQIFHFIRFQSTEFGKYPMLYLAVMTIRLGKSVMAVLLAVEFLDDLSLEIHDAGISTYAFSVSIG